MALLTLMRMRILVFTLVIAIIIFGSLSLPVNATVLSTTNHPFLTFVWTRDSENYTGSVISMSDTLKLDRARISLYDVNKRLRETGLLSEYSENRDLGQFIEFRDVNNNGKLDVADIFFIHEKGVTENWGVVFTYEPSGTILASKTFSNKEFSLQVDEMEYDPTIYILIFEINVFSLLLILMYIYTRKK